MSGLEDYRRENERLRAERLRLDRRIHNQRKAWRDNWAILETRSGYKALPEGVRSTMLRAWCRTGADKRAVVAKLATLRLLVSDLQAQLARVNSVPPPPIQKETEG